MIAMTEDLAECCKVKDLQIDAVERETSKKCDKGTYSYEEVITDAKGCCPQFNNVPIQLGVDEAGRGPVLGPMVYGCCFSPVDSHAQLLEIGFADSKKLTDDRRDELFEVIKDRKDILGYYANLHHAEELSELMLSNSRTSLNTISHDSAISFIRRALRDGLNVTKVFIDTVGIPEHYQQKLSQLFPGIEITVAKKADDLFAIVSAASIIAKVTRDRIMDVMPMKEVGCCNGRLQEINRGSGYPGDPATKSWLEAAFDSVFGFPSLVRFSWSTTDNFILENNGVAVDWHDEDESDDKQLGLMNFGVQKGIRATHRRNRMFGRRNLFVGASF